MQNKNVFLPDYSIGENVYSEVPKLCLNYGKKVVFIGGKTALLKASDLVRKELEKEGIQVLDSLWYGGEAAYENSEKLKQEKAVQDADVVFAFGGGKALDTCKVLTGQLGKTLFTFPTIASTCAAITAVCAVYKLSGEFDSLYWRARPAEHTFISTKVIAEAPEKYLWAGIGDTLAKAYEPEFSARGRELNYYNSLGITLSKLCVEPLLKYGYNGLRDCKNNKVSNDLEEVILSIIINTGIVSNHVINDYNSCVAHAMCYGFTTLEKVEHNHLHGEIVAYGVLVQTMLDGNLNELDRLLKFYKDINLPTSYKSFNVRWEEMEGVFQKAISVNDVKVAAVEITKEKLEKAVKDLENYIEKR
ncbi:iron-containing alcohol dehydrogenase family protein [Fusobacterium russii]|uniref:iron-containing alcohol dehydrogenase family protein n=1 Tax=Fusobacterium russii TaxID=854 RepID=UPI0003A689B4|nr:iron-containing alcohol dehydrogenase family protein [Fusobacterium russii]